jgi:DNA replication and repair protein RecF
VDGIEKGDISGYLGQVHSVVFFPESLRFVKGGPSLRRAVFDRAVASESPGHLIDSRNYNRLLLERNRILKQGGDSDMMETWDRRLVDAAARITVRRHRYLRSLRQLLNILSKNMGVESALGIDYRTDGFGGNKENWGETLGKTPPDKQELVAREALLERAERTRADESRRGTTLWGPHLDDFDVLWGDKRAKDIASQGEQRLIMIILVGAVAESYSQATGEGPIILFDDLSSELDEEKRGVVVNYLKSLRSQVFVTTTEKPSKGGETLEAKIYHVESGKFTAL